MKAVYDTPYCLNCSTTEHLVMDSRQHIYVCPKHAEKYADMASIMLAEINRPTKTPVPQQKINGVRFCRNVAKNVLSSRKGTEKVTAHETQSIGSYFGPFQATVP